MSIKLDAQDAMLLENMLLKERLANMNMKQNRNNYQTYLVNKYKIDTDKYQIKLDQAQGLVELVQIPEAVSE